MLRRQSIIHGLLFTITLLVLSKFSLYIKRQRFSLTIGMNQESSELMQTVVFKQLPDLSLHADIYYPPLVLSDELQSQSKTLTLVPAVIYFHGGGLSVGNRKSWFPTWLKQRTLEAGYLFISADYRLLPPSTGHEIVEDIRDLFAYLASIPISVQLDNRTSINLQVDPNAIAVSGSSAGGLCAYLAASHPSVSPKPKVVVSMYGMGGNFLIPHYLLPKDTIFFRGRELLDPADFPEYMYPYTNGPPLETAESLLEYHDATYRIPGYPANPRMLLARLYIQLGVFLDYYTGVHGLSEKLRGVWNGNSSSDMQVKLKEIIPSRHHILFPQFSVTSTWPATMLLHGTADSAVPLTESRNLKSLLGRTGGEVEMVDFEGEEHSFDYQPGAEEKYQKEMDDVLGFLKKWLGRSSLEL